MEENSDVRYELTHWWVGGWSTIKFCHVSKMTSHFSDTTVTVASAVRDSSAIDRDVFRRLRKTDSDAADVTCCGGRLFQIRAVPTGKVQLPIVDSRVRRTISDGDEAERRRRRASRSAGWLSLSARYDGAAPC